MCTRPSTRGTAPPSNPAEAIGIRGLIAIIKHVAGPVLLTKIGQGGEEAVFTQMDLIALAIMSDGAIPPMGLQHSILQIAGFDRVLAPHTSQRTSVTCSVGTMAATRIFLTSVR